MRSAEVRDWNAGSPGTHQIGAQSAKNPLGITDVPMLGRPSGSVAERNDLKGLLSGGRHAARKLEARADLAAGRCRRQC
jgi:hypothetical protein